MRPVEGDMHDHSRIEEIDVNRRRCRMVWKMMPRATCRAGGKTPLHQTEILESQVDVSPAGHTCQNQYRRFTKQQNGDPRSTRTQPVRVNGLRREPPQTRSERGRPQSPYVGQIVPRPILLHFQHSEWSLSVRRRKRYLTQHLCPRFRMCHICVNLLGREVRSLSCSRTEQLLAISCASCIVTSKLCGLMPIISLLRNFTMMFRKLLHHKTNMCACK